MANHKWVDNVCEKCLLKRELQIPKIGFEKMNFYTYSKGNLKTTFRPDCVLKIEIIKKYKP